MNFSNKKIKSSKYLACYLNIFFIHIRLAQRPDDVYFYLYFLDALNVVYLKNIFLNFNLYTMINHTYKNMTPPELESFSALVKTRLDENPILGSIKVAALADLAPAHKAFSDAKLDFENYKGPNRNVLRENCRLELVKQLYLTSVLVEALAKGDEEVINASGFALRKSTRPKTSRKDPLPVLSPANFNAVDIRTKPGSVFLTWSKVVGARTYAIERRLKGETVWQNGDYTSNCSIELSGLPSDSVYEFRVRAHGAGEVKSEFTTAVGVVIT